MSGVRALVRAIRQRLGPSGVSLRNIDPQAISSNQPDAGAAVRWIDAVSIAGRTCDALLCHPDSTVTFGLDAPPGATLTTWCGLQPECWPANRGGVRFTLTVDCGGLRRSRSLVMDPAGRSGDRRWRRLSVPFPRGSHADAVVTLATSLPAGAAGASAWAVWGDPRLEWRRRFGEQLASAIGAVRLLGMRGTIRRLQQVAARPDSSSTYRQWIAANTRDEGALAALEPEIAAMPSRPLVSVIMPVFNTPPAWLARAVESVRRQVYPNWQLSISDDGSTDEGTLQVLARLGADARIVVNRLQRNEGISAASNAALSRATGEWVALLDHDDELARDALAEVVRRIAERPAADVIYSDEDKIDQAGERCDPFFKPDWAPEHLLSCMYTCHLLVARKSLVDAVGGFRPGYEGSQDYDLMLRLIERTSAVEHIPRVLYHWRKSPASAAGAGLAKPWAIDAGRRALADYLRRNGLQGEVLDGATPGRYRVRWIVPGRPSVTAIVGAFAPLAPVPGIQLPGREPADEGRGRIEEIVVIAPGGNAGARGSTPASARVRTVVVPPGPGRIGAINDLVRETQGEHLFFIDAGLEPVTPGWLDAMLEHSTDAAIGAVGAKLVDRDGRLRHIGLVMGLRGVAGSPFAGYPGTAEGYISSAVGTRNYSAVSGACLMTRRDVFDSLGGFDARAGVAFAAIDYCLRARRSGLRVVFTPHATFRAATASSTVDDWGSDFMRVEWRDVIHDDPYYNLNLSRDFLDCRPRVLTYT